jgi:3-oxoadipate enol-lactonase
VIPVDLNCSISGPDDGPVLLLGGSLGTTMDMWDPQVRALSASHRIIRFEHRGHGGSPVPGGPYTMDDLGSDVVTMLDRLNLARVSYCGLSIGGMVGQWLAINAPERIDRLVLLCTAPHLPPPSAWHERAAAVRAAGTPEVVAEAVLGRWFTPEYAATHPDTVARYRAMISGIDADGYAGCCEAIAGMDLRSGLPGITAPTLVVAGRQDPSIPPEHGEAIAAAIPGARLEILDPAAHLASVERADAVNALIAAHLGDAGPGVDGAASGADGAASGADGAASRADGAGSGASS